ncbi:MAG: hypothetical protein FJ011_09275 [Chloroflexi bacterium]|nr:hypothetical protein [Chloroflexota bacterium]
MQFRTAAGHDAPAVTAAQMRFGNWLAARPMNRGYGLKITDLRPILGATLRCVTLGSPCLLTKDSLFHNFRL